MTVLQFREISVKVQDVLLPHGFMQTATGLPAVQEGLCKLNPVMILNKIVRRNCKEKYGITVVIIKINLSDSMRTLPVLNSEANTQIHTNSG